MTLSAKAVSCLRQLRSEYANLTPEARSFIAPHILASAAARPDGRLSLGLLAGALAYKAITLVLKGTVFLALFLLLAVVVTDFTGAPSSSDIALQNFTLTFHVEDPELATKLGDGLATADPGDLVTTVTTDPPPERTFLWSDLLGAFMALLLPFIALVGVSLCAAYLLHIPFLKRLATYQAIAALTFRLSLSGRCADEEDHKALRRQVYGILQAHHSAHEIARHSQPLTFISSPVMETS